MNSNCCLSLFHSLPLVQCCVSPHCFQCHLRLQLVFIYYQLSFCFLAPISYPTTSPIFFKLIVLHPSNLCLELSHFSIFCQSLSSQHSFISSIYFPKGPFFRFQTYADWLRQPNPQMLPSWVPCVQRLKLVPVYGALFLAVNSVFPLAYVRNEEFLDQNFFFR